MSDLAINKTRHTKHLPVSYQKVMFSSNFAASDVRNGFLAVFLRLGKDVVNGEIQKFVK